jgi:hypothetical protein
MQMIRQHDSGVDPERKPPPNEPECMAKLRDFDHESITAPAGKINREEIRRAGMVIPLVSRHRISSPLLTPNAKVGFADSAHPTCYNREGVRATCFGAKTASDFDRKKHIECVTEDKRKIERTNHPWKDNRRGAGYWETLFDQHPSE